MAYNGKPPFVRNSDTSKAASNDVAGRTASLRARCLQLIKDANMRGMTCDEIELVTGERHQTISARVRELVLADKILDSGARRATSSGSQARIYRFVQE
jgi:hypothetical protein